MSRAGLDLEHPSISQESPPLQLVDVLRMVCRDLDAPAADIERIVQEGCLRLEDVDLVLRLNDDTWQLEIYAECGVPSPKDEAGLYRFLLEEQLLNALPALSVGVHPESGTVVCKAMLFAPAIEPDDRSASTVLRLLVSKARLLRERYSLRPVTQGFT
jgi:hypothetical protein